MMGAHYLCWCLAFLLIPNLDAKSFKLVPGRTKTITTNGITQEISRYMVVPDDQNNGHTNKTIAKATKLLTADNENGIVKALNETADTNSGNMTDNQKIKANTASETNVENVRNNLIKTIRIMQARQDNASKYSKSTETPTLDKYQSFFTSLSARNNKHSDQDDDDAVRIRNTEKNNGRGTVEHTKVTLNLKPQPTFSQSKVVYIKHNNEEKDKENMNEASEFIIQNKLERPASTIISNLNRHTSKSKESEIINLKDKEKLIEAIGINQMFTIPGKRGRYKLLYEENDDHDNVDQKIYTIHYSGEPKHKTVYHHGIEDIPYQQQDFSLGSPNFVTPTHFGGSVLETNLDKISNNRDDDNLSIVGETSNDKKYGLEVVTGKMNLLKEYTENEHLDTSISSESKNNLENTEPTSNETILHNAQVYRKDLNVLPLTVNHTNSIEIHNTKLEKSNTITLPEAFISPSYDEDILLGSIKNSSITQDSETLNHNTDLIDKDSEHNGIFAAMFNNYDPIPNKDNNYPFVDQTIVSDKVKKPLTDVVSDYSSDSLNKYEKVTNPKMVISEENAQPTAVETTVSDDDNHLNQFETVKETNTSLENNELLGETNFSNGSSELRDIIVESSTAGVDMKPVLRETENMDAVQIESSSASSVLYETEKSSIDVVTEPSVELLDDGKNITDPKTDTMSFTIAQSPSKISEINKYKELDDDKKTAASGKNNKLEYKVKPVSNGVEEHIIIVADVSESSESSEVLRDDNNIKGVDMKPVLRETENMDAVQIESSSASSVLYETEKSSIDGVTEPSVELLDDGKNITDPKTDTMIFTIAQILSKINKYKELDDDKKTAASGNNNKLEYKVKPVSNGVEEHIIIVADVSESSESSEVLKDDNNIKGVDMKPVFRETENMDAVQIESSSASTVLYETEKPSLDIVTEPSVNEINKYKEMDDDKKTAASGNNNKLEYKVKPVSNGVEEHIIIVADVSESSESSEVLKDDNNIKGVDIKPVLRETENMDAVQIESSSASSVIYETEKPSLDIVTEPSVNEINKYKEMDDDKKTAASGNNNKLEYKVKPVFNGVEEHIIIVADVSESSESSEVLKDDNNIKGVDIKPVLRETENMDAVQIESSSASSVLYESEKPSIDVVTQPLVELLYDGKNITDPKTDTMIFTIPNKMSESNKYKELDDDKKSAASGKDKLEYKVKPVSNDVEEHSVADVSESTESSESLEEDNNIKVTATKKPTVSTVSSETESGETNVSKELEKEAAELVTDGDVKVTTDELLSVNNKTEKLKIEYAAIPEDNLRLEQTQEDCNENILTNSLEQVDPSLLEQPRSPTKHLTDTRTLREKLKSSLDVVKQLDDFYHDIHKARREPDNSNNHKHEPEKLDLNFKLDTPSEALTVEIKQENIQPSQHASQPIANDYHGGENQDNENDGSDEMGNVYSNYRNPYVISDQYLQKILTFLTSKKVMQLLQLKYDIGYGDTDKIRKSHIIEQLQNLGWDKINPIQLFILSQLVRQIEEVNKNNNQKVTHDYDPNLVAKYYYMPYAKVYPIVQFQNDVKFNTAIRALVSRAMHITTVLRTHGVPKYQISFYESEVHKHLNNNAVQSYLNNCEENILAGLSKMIDSLARQAMMV